MSKKNRRKGRYNTSKIVKKFKEKLETFLCDTCGFPKEGAKYSVFDENFNTQPGLDQCEECYSKYINCRR